ncbi:rRNA methyltransferase 2, mitochondrial [Schizosaccharomyces pombe]
MFGSKTLFSWAAKRSKDFYRKKSKIDNFRSRAAYKLIELNSKYRFINKEDVVIDVGFAPGSWSQVAKKLVGNKGKVIGIDIQHIAPPEGVLPIYGDIRDPNTLTKLFEALRLRHEPDTNDSIDCRVVDAVISDMLHKATGIRIRDHALSMELCASALHVALTFLKSNGSFICKFYMGDEDADLQNLLKSHFRFVQVMKPKASLKESREAYFVCLERKP